MTEPFVLLLLQLLAVPNTIICIQAVEVSLPVCLLCVCMSVCLTD
jgi:hypothetical protein